MLLFVAYIQPLGHILRRHGVMFHGYADDTQIYVKFRPNNKEDLLAATKTLECCIHDVRTWMIFNKLKFNDSKTEFLPITTSYYNNWLSKQKLEITIGDAVVRPSQFVKNLGAIFDDTMCMSKHIACINKKLCFALRCLWRVRPYLDYSACAAAVNSLVTSRLDYDNS